MDRLIHAFPAIGGFLSQHRGTIRIETGEGHRKHTDATLNDEAAAVALGFDFEGLVARHFSQSHADLWMIADGFPQDHARVIIILRERLPEIPIRSRVELPAPVTDVQFRFTWLSATVAARFAGRPPVIVTLLKVELMVVVVSPEQTMRPT